MIYFYCEDTNKKYAITSCSNYGICIKFDMNAIAIMCLTHDIPMPFNANTKVITTTEKILTQWLKLIVAGSLVDAKSFKLQKQFKSQQIQLKKRCEAFLRVKNTVGKKPTIFKKNALAKFAAPTQSMVDMINSEIDAITEKYTPAEIKKYAKATLDQIDQSATSAVNRIHKLTKWQRDKSCMDSTQIALTTLNWHLDQALNSNCVFDFDRIEVTFNKPTAMARNGIINVFWSLVPTNAHQAEEQTRKVS